MSAVCKEKNRKYNENNIFLNRKLPVFSYKTITGSKKKQKTLFYSLKFTDISLTDYNREKQLSVETVCRLGMSISVY